VQRLVTFTRAIVRPPAETFFEGLTTADWGRPDYPRALRQHESYCVALERCGLELTILEPDSLYPDSTFVEDPAVLAGQYPVLTRPGAPSREGEVASIRGVLGQFFPALDEIRAPGTLDGGDVCEAGNHFFIGVSARTNEAGAKQLADFLERSNYTSSLVDIRGIRDILHLKSGLAYLGGNRLVVTDTFADREEFRGYELVIVDRAEEYAANCVKVNDYVLVAAGYPLFRSTLQGLGYQTISLDMSEFQKMDGGLSCLSLRF
jgi:dimethylargininase